MYGKTMKQLRKLAMVFHVKQLDVTRMAETIKTICAQEKVAIPGDLALQVCRQSKTDMRNCLNTLQMAIRSTEICGSPHRVISRESLFIPNSDNILNSKDSFQGIFDIWQELCTPSLALKAQNTTKHIRKLVMSHDSPSFILDGIHFNALNGTGTDIKVLAEYYVDGTLTC